MPRTATATPPTCQTKPVLDIEHLVYAMATDGQSATQLASNSGYSKQYVNDLLKGRRRGNPVVIKKLATALGCPVSMLTRHEPAA